MPFTFSHPAAILPFRFLPVKYISVTGLFVGSIVPDFEYFIRCTSRSYYSHTWGGLFWFDFPLALLLCFLFHNIVRDALIENLPRRVSLRFTHCYCFNWNGAFRRRWLVVCLCILAGAASHLLWDQLTHETVDNLVQSEDFLHGSHSLNGFIVYYGWWGLNSITGMLLLAVYAWKLPVQRKMKVRMGHGSYWPLVLIVAVLFFFMRLVIKDNISFIDAVDTGIAGVLVGLLVVSLRKRTAEPVFLSPEMEKVALRSRDG